MEHLYTIRNNHINMNQPQIITAIIALIGVIISIVISYITSSKNVKVELRKHQEQIMQEFGQRLFEKRIECYPKLYSIVCRYARDLKENRMNISLLKEYYNETSDWDVNNSIYMSAKTQYIFHQFRIELLNISKLAEEDFKATYKNIEEQKKLRGTSNKVELALKNELRIYSFESPYKIIPEMSFDTYADADNHVLNL